MSFLRSLDLYKVIVLLSLVLLPTGYWWVKNIDEQIVLCKNAIVEATRAGGTIEQIGVMQKKVEIVALNRRSASDAIKEPRTYFEGQILAAGSGLKGTDFTPVAPKEEPAHLGSSRQRASDFVVDIEWKTDRPVQLDFVYAVLWNCESGARAGGEQSGPSSVWKLRDLSLTNASIVGANKTPDPEMQDRWLIKEMKFARREPKKSN